MAFQRNDLAGQRSEHLVGHAVTERTLSGPFNKSKALLALILDGLPFRPY